jgi:hypothetical protein
MIRNNINRNILKSLILFQFMSIFTIVLHGQEVKQYNLDVKIDIELNKVDVKGTLLIDFGTQDSITFYLWRNSRITSVSSNKMKVPYTFDTIKPLDLPFILNAGIMVVSNPKLGTEPQLITFEYHCDMQRNMVGFGKTFTDKWIEMGYYSAWYPVHEESRNFISEVNVYIDNEVNISGSGRVTKKHDYWQMSQPWESFDILIVASKDLKIKKIEKGNIHVETVYATFPKSDIDSIFAAFTDVLEFFNALYGEQNGDVYLKFIIDPTEGTGGYGRKNLIRLKVSNFSYYFKLGIAHELSHSWWYKADTKTWEDWLNESFAEYSLLLYLRERIDTGLYNETLERYKQNSQNMPAIWGIDRTSERAYTTLYEKGSLLLMELEKKLGKEKMAAFLRLLIDKSIDNTTDFLKVLEEFSSKEIQDWFESELRK